MISDLLRKLRLIEALIFVTGVALALSDGVADGVGVGFGDDTADGVVAGVLELSDPPPEGGGAELLSVSVPN